MCKIHWQCLNLAFKSSALQKFSIKYSLDCKEKCEKMSLHRASILRRELERRGSPRGAFPSCKKSSFRGIVKTSGYPIHHWKYARGASIEGHKREAKRRAKAKGTKEP